MSFVNLIPIAFNALNLLGEASKLLSQLNEEKEKAKDEIKKTLGREVDIELALVKTKGGAKFALLIDLPGNIEENIAEIARALGVNLEVITANV